MPVRRVLLAVLAALLLAPAGAAAAAPPYGGLTRIGCAADGGAGGCVAAPGLAGVSAVTVSEDGRGVFAASPADSAVMSLRERTLEPLGCVAAQPTPGCVQGRALAGATDVAATRDRVYVAARDADAVSAYLVTEGGSLLPLPGAEGCVAMAVAGCATGRALDEPVAVTVTRGSLYVASRGSDAVAIFTITAGGGLVQRGCVMQGPGAAAAGCAQGRALEDPADIAYDGSWMRPQPGPGSEEVYVASSGSDGVALLRGDAMAGCITQGGTEGCATGRALDGASGIAVTLGYEWATSSHWDDVFVAAPEAGALAVLRGLSQTGCLAAGGAHGCTPVAGLEGVRVLAMPQSSWYPIADAGDYGGSHLYAAGSGALRVFGRDARTTALSDVHPSADAPGASSVVVSREIGTRFAYAAMPGESAVVAFARQMRPACGGGWGPPPEPIEVPAGRTTRITVPECYDPNGDALTYSVESPPAHGRLGALGADRTVAYTPAAGHVGDDAFAVRASDGGESAVQPVRLRVTGTRDTRAPRVRILDRVVRFGPRGRAVLRLRADEACRAGVEVRRRGRRVARGSFALPANRTRRVIVRLTRRRTGRATVVVRARDDAGNAGRSARVVRLRRR